jgi:hypothetical protein
VAWAIKKHSTIIGSLFMDIAQWIYWMIPGAAIGVALGYFLNRIYHRKWIPLVCVVLSMNLAPNIASLFFSSHSSAPETSANDPVESEIRAISEKSLTYKLLLENDADFNKELRAQLSATPSSVLSYQDFLTLMSKYFNKYLPYAEDEAVAKAMSSKMKVFAKIPMAECVAIFSGNSAEVQSSTLYEIAKSESIIMESGIAGFKNGVAKKEKPTAQEYHEYVLELGRKYGNLDVSLYFENSKENYNYDQEMRDGCKASAALSILDGKENPQKIANFWRALLL